MEKNKFEFLDNLKGFNWRSVQRYANPKAANDLNVFLENLPHHANKTVLIVAAVIWAFAAALGLFTTVKIQELSRLSSEDAQAQAVLPKVPSLKDTPIEAASVKTFVDELQKTYKDLEISGRASDIIIRAKSTALFGEFREAIGHVQNGGSGWRVSIDKLCVGKECKQFPLSASLKINKIRVE